MELTEALARRHMVRAFRPVPIEAVVLDRVVHALFRGPSAGFAQGLEVLVLDMPAPVERFWSVAFPDPAKRASFRWQGLFEAPVLLIPVVSPHVYATRYGEADKAASGLGDESAWPVPYWWVDGGMGVMASLLSAVDEELGALFFGLFDHEEAVLTAFGVPPGHRALGAVALGYPAPDEPGRSAATRPRRCPAEVIHRSQW